MPLTFDVQPAGPDVGDGEIEALLGRVYVDGGFTEPQLAATVFSAAAVRARGEILLARDRAEGAILGMVIVVPPTSPARLLAEGDEAEMHLLAVAPQHRQGGVGRALVAAAMHTARRDGFTRMLLWTQPSMLAAQRLYAEAGFVRVPERDFRRSGREFLFFEAVL
jgi:ribosomal protein S18 acetylase RimI-like enzyme